MIESIRTGAALAALFIAVPAVPDVIPPPPPGAKRVPVYIDARLADPDGLWVVGHRIEDGDTFGGIAERHLGSAGFTGWLADLNSDLDPRRLTIGASLWLPRRAAVGDDGAPLVYADASRPGFLFARRFTPGADGAEHASVLLLVDQAQRREFERCFDSDHWVKSYRALEAAGHVTRLGLAGLPEGFVPVDSPIVRIEVDAALRMDADGQPRFEADEVRFLDADGAELEPPKSVSRRWESAPTAPPESSWWPLLLAGAAACMLALVAFRRVRVARSV